MDLPEEFLVRLAKPVVMQGRLLEVLSLRRAGDEYELVLPDVPDEMVLELQKPLVFGGETHHSLQLREPTAGQLEEAVRKGGTEIYQAKMLIALVGKVPPPLVEALPAREFKRAAEYISNFV